jgi:hypothetical protein
MTAPLRPQSAERPALQKFRTALNALYLADEVEPSIANDIVALANAAITEAEAYACALPSAEQLTVRPPFQKALTVVMVRDSGPEQADKDLATVKDHSATVFRVGVPELYLHQLRLRAEEDPSLLDKIAVFFLDENNVMREVGLRFEDELKWPAGFMDEAWDIEVQIQKLRCAKREGKANG